MGNQIGILAATFVITSGSICGASWQEINTGLPGRIAGAAGLALDSATPSILYSWGSGGSLLKSTDGGASWNIVNGLTGVDWLVVDPKDSPTIYAGTGRGLAKSSNGGASWAFVNIAPDTSLVAPLVVDPQDSNTFYAVTPGGIVKSIDGGESWSTLPGSQGLQARFLTVDPKTPSTLYAVGVPGRGILKSINGGENWAAIKAGQGVGFVETVTALVVDPVSPSTIYAAARVDTGPNSADEIIYKSSDGGQNWRAVRAGIPAGASITSVAIDPGSPSRIYATYRVNGGGGGWGIIKSTDGAESWAAMNAGLPSGDFIGSPVAIDPSSPATLYIGYVDRGGAGAGGIVKSTDGAASWNPANAGRRFIDVRVVASDPLNAGTNYASIGSDGVFKTVDGGETWQKLAAFQFSTILGFSGQGYARSLAIDFRRPNILYALTARSDGCLYLDELLFKSTDNGASWSSISPPMSGCILWYVGQPAMVLNPADPNNLYVGADLDGAPAMYKSPDGGASWNEPLWGCCNNGLAIDPNNASTLYGGTPSGLLKSSDGGANWSNTGLSASVNVLALDPANASVLYAATEGSGSSGFAGLFKSTDGGENWAPINDGLDSLIAMRSRVTALVADAAIPQVIYAATSGYGVFRSTDGGAHWSPFNDGLTNLDVRLLALAPGTANLYAGTGNGIFLIDLASETIPSMARNRSSW